MQTVKVRILSDHFPGHKRDAVVSVSCDANGLPLDQHWRRRFADAKRDGSLELVNDPPAAPAPKARTKTKPADPAEE